MTRLDDAAPGALGHVCSHVGIYEPHRDWERCSRCGWVRTRKMALLGIGFAPSIYWHDPRERALRGEVE